MRFLNHKERHVFFGEGTPQAFLLRAGLSYDYVDIFPLIRLLPYTCICGNIQYWVVGRGLSLTGKAATAETLKLLFGGSWDLVAT